MDKGRRPGLHRWGFPHRRIDGAFISTRHEFPGLLALAPTIGAALVIAAGQGAGLNVRVLSSRPAVFVGLISYPLYLWHWPLLSFVHIYEPEVYSPIAEMTNSGRIRYLKIAAILISLLAATLTYHLIERRVRKLPPRPVMVRLSFLVSLLALLGVVIFSSGGLAEIRGPLDGPSSSKLKQPVYLDCTSENGAIFNAAYFNQKPTCPYSGGGANLDILIFGDSRGMDFYRGIENSEYSIGIFEANACMPFEGFKKDEKGTCLALLKRFHELVKTHKPSTIVVSLYFARFYTWYGKEQDLNTMARDSFSKLTESNNLTVMLDFPILTFSPDNCRSRPIKQKLGCVMSRDVYVEQRNTYEQGLRDAAQGIANITFVDPEGLFCSGETCYGARDGILLYRDTNHLTNEGSIILGKWFLDKFIQRSKGSQEGY